MVMPSCTTVAFLQAGCMCGSNYSWHRPCRHLPLFGTCILCARQQAWNIFTASSPLPFLQNGPLCSFSLLPLPTRPPGEEGVELGCRRQCLCSGWAAGMDREPDLAGRTSMDTGFLSPTTQKNYEPCRHGMGWVGTRRVAGGSWVGKGSSTRLGTERQEPVLWDNLEPRPSQFCHQFCLLLETGEDILLDEMAGGGVKKTEGCACLMMVTACHHDAFLCCAVHHWNPIFLELL